MGRQYVTDDDLVNLHSSFRHALMGGGPEYIDFAATALSENLPDYAAATVLWKAIDALGPGARAAAQRQSVGYRLFHVLGDMDDIYGQWKVCVRLILAEPPWDQGWHLLSLVLAKVPEGEHESWDRAFEMLEKLHDHGEDVAWSTVDNLLESSLKGYC